MSTCCTAPDGRTWEEVARTEAEERRKLQIQLQRIADKLIANEFGNTKGNGKS
jgi:hypothetical protein